MALIEREDHNGVTVLALNRPERRNALSSALIEALHAALDEVEADEAVRVVVLTGRGQVFCAGGDLAGGLFGGDGVVAAERARARFGGLLGRLPRLSRPVVAAVQGDALGGGLGLMAACDLAVIDAGAQVGTPEVHVGLFPLVITAILQRQVARKPLLELMLTGAKVDAARAVELGLANRVSAPGEALAEALALGSTLAARSRAVLALGKASFHQAADLPYEAALELLNGRLTVNLLMDDAAEGMAAFVEKRRPQWRDR